MQFVPVPCAESSASIIVGMTSDGDMAQITCTALQEDKTCKIRKSPCLWLSAKKHIFKVTDK